MAAHGKAVSESRVYCLASDSGVSVVQPSSSNPRRVSLTDDLSRVRLGARPELAWEADPVSHQRLRMKKTG